ncbi:MAG: hypothetical protein ACPKOI_04580 [Pleomorphochaeta sp.]
MKKIIIIFLLLGVLPEILFAGPISQDCFFDVEGDVLTEHQMDNIEGEGFLSFLTGTISGCIMGGVVSACTLLRPSTDYSNPGGAAQSILDGMWQGALSGALLSFTIPL